MRPGVRASAIGVVRPGESSKGDIHPMDWQRIERKLARSFHARPEHVGASVVVHRRRPLPLAAVLEDAMTTGERAEYGELEHWPGSTQR